MYSNGSDFWAFILYPATLLNCCMNSSNLGIESFGFLGTVSCHLQRGRIWRLLCQFECLLFLFVAWLLRLGLLVLCWIAVVRVDIPVLFLILGERLPVFPHWEWYLLWAFRRWLSRCWSMFPLSLRTEEFWSGMDPVFCQMLSLFVLRRSYGSCLFFLVDMIYHIDCFTSVEPALHPGDKSHLVMASNLLNVLLDPVGSYLVENVCIHVHQGY